MLVPTPHLSCREPTGAVLTKGRGGSIHTSEHTQEALNTLLSGPGVLKSGHTGGDPQ